MILTALALCLSASALPQQPVAPRLDVVRLKNGDTLTGRILTALDGYVEIELGAGATVGISRAQIEAVERGTGDAPAPERGPVPARSEWFVLYDGTGTSVGWMQSGVTVDADGSLLVSEEYEFFQGARRYQVTSQVRATAQMAPVSCYFRERVAEPVVAMGLVPGASNGRSERIVDERILDARCEGEQLIVQRLDRNGRRQRELPWNNGATFPLLARLVAQHGRKPQGSTTVFDPANDELATRAILGGSDRSVRSAGTAVTVTEFVETAGEMRNTLWLDAAGRTLRRELAGPALVAMRSSSDSAPRMAGSVRIAAAQVTEADGTFSCWIPNPGWEPTPETPSGRIALSGPLPGAQISITRLEHLEPNAPLATAADAVGNWFLLLQPGLRWESRSVVTRKGRDTVRLIATGKDARAIVEVAALAGGFVVASCVAPRAHWAELEGDFEFALRSLELGAEAVAPQLQGPVQRRAAAEAAVRPATSTPVEAAAPTRNNAPGTAARPLPRVRVPIGS